MMRALSATAERLAQGLALVGAIGIVLMMLHVGADILSRNLMGRPIPATHEIVSRYYMVLIGFLPLAWVERRRGMVAVEVLEWMLGPRGRRFSDLLVALIAFGIYAGLAWVTWHTALSNWRSGSFVTVLNYRLPVWPTYFLLPAGLALAALATLVRALEVLTGYRPDAAAPGMEDDA